MAYIDTSVLVAYYYPEALSSAAQLEIRAASPPAKSMLCELEFISALALKTRTGELPAESAQVILSVFRRHRTDGIYRILPIEDREYSTACKWLSMFKTTLRAPDAFHLAAAFSNGLTLITADKALSQAADLFHISHRLLG